MSKAVVKYENKGHRVDEVMIVKCEFNKEFTVYLSKNIHKNVKSYNGGGSWIFTGGASINQMILEKVVAIFGVEEEVTISSKEISPAHAPKTTESKKENKVKEEIKTTENEVIVKTIEELPNITTENGVIVEKDKTETTDEIKHFGVCYYKGSMKIQIDLRGCKTKEDVNDRFSEACWKQNFNMNHDDDLVNPGELSTATIDFGKNYISIDDKQGRECYYVEICDCLKDSIELYVKLGKKEIAYHNSNNDWFIINGNYKDREKIADEGIKIQEYAVVNIESDSYESVEEFNKEISSGYWRFYLYTADNEKIILEDNYGCFHFFDTEDELYDFIKPEYSQAEDEMFEDYIDECLQD
jgi:hypothetical protein